jgi:hypothetical protein
VTRDLYGYVGLRPVAQIQFFIGRADTNREFFNIADSAWPASHIFMCVIGVATLLVRVWTGWRKFTPLLCGLVLPLAMAAGGLGGRVALEVTFGVLTAASFPVLGYAIRTFKFGQ